MNKALTIQQIVKISPVIPVVTINDESIAKDLAFALLNGGIAIIEITLRTPTALDIIESLALNYPNLLVGAGTIINAKDMIKAKDAGAKFLVSPGLSDELLTKASNLDIPILPGIATPSDIIKALDYGYRYLKFFPASSVGGIAMLKSLNSVFSKISFIPTGGINQDNFSDYLRLSNVACVGGSWMIPNKFDHNTDFAMISKEIQIIINQCSKL